MKDETGREYTKIEDKTTGMMDYIAQDCVVSFPGGPQWQELVDIIQRRHGERKAAHARLHSWTRGKGHHAGMESDLYNCFYGPGKTDRASRDFPGDPLMEGSVNLACVFMSEADAKKKKAGLFRAAKSDIHPEDTTVSLMFGSKSEEKAHSKAAKQAAKARKTIAVECPPGVEAGAMVMVDGPDGTQFQAQIPPGVDAGTTFQVVVPQQKPGHALSFTERVNHPKKKFQCYCARLGSMNFDANCGYQVRIYATRCFATGTFIHIQNTRRTHRTRRAIRGKATTAARGTRRGFRTSSHPKPGAQRCM